jgi:predicted transcriptional regulator
MAKLEISPLTAAQREIMEVVWTRGEVTVAEVREALAAKREVARNTVQTMLVRLEARGWLTHREVRRSFVYAAKKPRKMSFGAKLSQMVDRWFGGSAEEVVTALIEYRGLTSDEAKRIREMIDKAEKAKRK